MNRDVGDLAGAQIEQRSELKKSAVLFFSDVVNPIGRRIYGIPEATYGIVMTGKSHAAQAAIWRMDLSAFQTVGAAEVPAVATASTCSAIRVSERWSES
ncbi:hypothetical protein AC629_32330 [Bradyrhizobium sp. NAS80.1]|uniref:hypothetical protein n=1 Tax=Bradyrhizobium sp. NAS80.1 TaxID=1680159 RepID=UPI000967E231|nr:hypothetical protein [Bradyrhizobium sp. NAS80.1]OKO76965.1 hypothetical protein AC629_32330 [Bradyrhizobium sp. NAS80.1]